MFFQLDPMKHILFTACLFTFLSCKIYAQTFSGTYEVGGVSPDYGTITAAINALKSGVVTGPVIFNIRDGEYNESLNVPFVAGMSRLNTVTFKSESNDAGKVIVKAVGYEAVNIVTSYVNLQHLTILNETSSTFPIARSAILLRVDILNPRPIEFVSITDCIIRVDTTLATTYGPKALGIWQGGVPVSNILLERNTIIGGITTIEVGTCAGVSIRSNKILSSYMNAIFANRSANLEITGNYISLRKVVSPRTEANGIYLIGVQNTLVANNMIAGGFEQTALGYGIYLASKEENGGIETTLANSANIYHNSVLYDGTGSSSAAGRIEAGKGIVNLKNNIFYNTGGGYAYQTRFDSEYDEPVESDHNDFITAGSYLANVNGLRYATLPDLQTVTGKDANSVSANPGFVSPGDVHALSVKIDGKGISVPEVTTDYDGQARNSAPDIGADEFSLPNIDIAVAEVTILAAPVHKSAVPIRVLLRNNGIQSLKDSLISLSYSIDGGSSWTAPETVQLSGMTASGDTEGFTLAQQLQLDSLQTYTVLVRINPPGLIADAFSLNDQLSTIVCMQLAGNYTIGKFGSLADFKTISQAMQLLNCGGIAGPVRFTIRKGIYEEKVTIGEIPGSSAANTVMIESESGNPEDVTIRFKGNGGPDHAVVQLNGVDHVTFRGFTIINSNTEVTASGIHLTNQADHNTIENCIVKVKPGTFGNFMGIVASIESSILYGAENARYTLIKNCRVEGGGRGMSFTGKKGSADKGNRFIGNTTLSHIDGIRLEYQDIDEISGNKIILQPTDEDNVYDSYHGYGILLKESKSASIIKNNAVSGFARAGIYLHRSDKAVIVNNMVMDPYPGSLVLGVDTSMCSGIGLWESSDIAIYFNSVKLDNDSNSACFFQNASPVNSPGSGIRIKNNILINKAKGYAYYSGAPAALDESDYNDLFTNGSRIAHWDKQDAATFQDFKSLSGKDANSFTQDVAFVSNTDLHLTDEQLQGKALHMSAVTEDYDGDYRNPSLPTVGSDDFRFYDIGITRLEKNYTGQGDYEIRIMLENKGAVSLDALPIALSYSVDGGLTWSPAEPLIIKGLFKRTDELMFVFTSKWHAGEGTYNVCARVQQPGIVQDKNKVNDQFCTELDICSGNPGNIITIGGPGADFQTITTALQSVYSWLDNDICGLNGPLTFLVNDGIYNERLLIHGFKGASPGAQVTIRSVSGNPENVLISMPSGPGEQHATVMLTNVSYLNIEKLSLESTGREQGTALYITGASVDNRVTGCILRADADSPGVSDKVFPLWYDGGMPLPPLASAWGLYVDSSVLISGYQGINLSGNFIQHKNTVRDNIITGTYQDGIFVEGNADLILAGNRITPRPGNMGSTGISIYNSNGDLEINANYVRYAGSAGILAENITGGTKAFIANNMISGGFNTPLLGAGISLEKVNKMGVWHNSVQYDEPSSIYSYALYTEEGSQLDIRNNIFSNTGGGYAYHIKNPAAVTVSDYNVLHTTGAKLANWNGDHANLAALRAVSGKENNSFSFAPVFVSDSDLHTFQPELDGKAQFIPAAALDFDGHWRNKQIPDIGADEFTNGTDGGAVTFLSPSDRMGIKDSAFVEIRVTNYGNSSISNFPVGLLLNDNPVAAETFTGSLSPGASANYRFSYTFTSDVPGMFVLKAFTGISGDISVLNDTAMHTVEVITVGVPQDNISRFEIYPNPASGQVCLDISVRQQVSMQVILTDMTGRMHPLPVQDRLEPGLHKLILPLQTFPSGIYLVSIITPQQVYRTRCVITR